MHSVIGMVHLMLLSNWFLNGIQAIVMHTLWPFVHVSVVLLLFLTFARNSAGSFDKATISRSFPLNNSVERLIIRVHLDLTLCACELKRVNDAFGSVHSTRCWSYAFHKIFMSFFRFICRHKETEDKNAAGCWCCFFIFLKSIFWCNLRFSFRSIFA